MIRILNNYKNKIDVNIRQVVAYKDGVKVLEAYKEGFKRDDTLTVMSVTKSVTALKICPIRINFPSNPLVLTNLELASKNLSILF